MRVTTLTCDKCKKVVDKLHKVGCFVDSHSNYNTTSGGIDMCDECIKDIGIWGKRVQGKLVPPREPLDVLLELAEMIKEHME